MTLKSKRKNRAYTKMQHLFNWLMEQKQTSVNFHWLSEGRCKQLHLSMKFLKRFALTSFEMQLCDWEIEMFTVHIRSFLYGNEKKFCFNLAKHWPVKQIADNFSRSYESHSVLQASK